MTKQSPSRVKFKCKIGKMSTKMGKIIWIPKRFADTFSEDTYVEVTMRKLK